MDAGIQAMDGNLTVLQMLLFGNVVTLSLPSLDAGFRHPCRNDGLPAFVYNDERWSVGRIKITELLKFIYCISDYLHGCIFHRAIVKLNPI